MKKKALVSLLLAVTLLTGSLAACSGSSSTGGASVESTTAAETTAAETTAAETTAAETTTAGTTVAGATTAATTTAATTKAPAATTAAPKAQAPAAATKTEPVTITFWHSMNTDVLPKIVEEFNKSQSNVIVKCVYQGGYGDTLNAYKMAMTAGGQNAPDLVQVYEGGASFMMESGFATPVQNYIDEQKVDMSSMLSQVKNYYTINGKMYAMPFNCSSAVLYYNKDMFRQAGLDPSNPPKDFNELNDAAKRLKTASVAGLALPIDCSLFEFNMVNIGKDIVNNGNGRTSRATQAVFGENGGGLKVFIEYNKLYQTSACIDVGADALANSIKAFIAGKAAMTISTSSLITTAQKSIAGKFTMGIGAMPIVDSKIDCGIPVSGGTLWLSNKGDKAKEAAAFELMKYLISPEVQAKWSMATGYYAINKNTYDLKVMKDFTAANPEFTIAVNQLKASPSTAVGCVYGVNMEARSKIENHWRYMMTGKETPDQAITASEKEITDLIKQYNQANPAK